MTRETDNGAAPRGRDAVRAAVISAAEELFAERGSSDLRLRGGEASDLSCAFPQALTRR